MEEEFEDTKWVIRIRISKNRQLNGQTKKDKRTNNDLQTEGQIIQWSKEKGQKDKQ